MTMVLEILDNNDIEKAKDIISKLANGEAGNKPSK